jgi:capsid protein
MINLASIARGILSRGYDAGESKPSRMDLGWDRRTETTEDAVLGPDGSRATIRLRGVDLKRNAGVVAGFCSRLAKFSVGPTGIGPQARTSDEGWNRAAEQWFWEVWGPQCDSRGRLTLAELQFMAVFLRPIHGGIYLQKIADGTVRPIECERIRDPQVVADRPGFTDGVKVDQRTGRLKSYLVHARDAQGGFGNKHEEFEIAAGEILPVISPPWRVDQVREIPDLAPVIPLLQDIHELNNDTRATAKAHSKIVGWINKLGGMGANSLPRGTTSQTVGKRQEHRLDGLTLFEGFPGESMTSFNSQTPNNLHIPYAQWLHVLCGAACDLPYEFFTLDFSKCDWSRMKGAIAMINSAMRHYRTWLRWRLNGPLWAWRVGMEMGPGGALSPAPTNAQGRSEWDLVEWNEPEELTVDRKEGIEADVMEYQMGQRSLEEMAARRGKDLEKLLRKIAGEKQMIAKIEEEFDLPPGSLVNTQMPGQGTAPAAPEAPAVPAAEPPPPKEAPDVDE